MQLLPVTISFEFDKRFKLSDLNDKLLQLCIKSTLFLQFERSSKLVRILTTETLSWGIKQSFDFSDFLL